MSKTITTRISNKIDTEQNWNSVDLPALEGELIVYSADESHSSPRVKIGDGTTPIKDLPFIGATGSGGIPVVTLEYDAENSTGSSKVFTATVEGLTELYTGFQVIIVLPISSATLHYVRININNLGPLPIKRYASSDVGHEEFMTATSLVANSPTLLVYDTSGSSPCWIAIAHSKPLAGDITGGAFSEKLVAYNPRSSEDYTGKQIRNSFLIAEGDDLPSNGANGDLCFVYTL